MPDAGDLVIDHGHVQPTLVVLLRQPFLRDEGGRIDDLALADEGRQQAGLREVGDVGGVAGIHADADGTLKLLAADVLHVDAGGLLKGRHRLLELDRVGVGEGAVNRHDRAAVLAGHGRFQRTAGHHREGPGGFGRLFDWFLGRSLGRFGRGFLGGRFGGDFGRSCLLPAATGRQDQGEDEQKA